MTLTSFGWLWASCIVLWSAWVQGAFLFFYYTLTCTSKQSSKMYNNFACVLCSVLTCAMKQNVVQCLKVR